MDLGNILSHVSGQIEEEQVMKLLLIVDVLC